MEYLARLHVLSMHSIRIVPILLLLGAALLDAKVITREEALQQAFPGATIEPEMLFLTPAEMHEVEKASGTQPPTAMVARYVAVKEDQLVGRAYLDTHVVRTKKESLLIILDQAGAVKRVEIVAFMEPPEFIPSERWYQQFQGQALDDGLRLGRDIHPVAGASLTARATTDAVRRALAIDRLVAQRAQKGAQR